jgi:hydroxyacylglutathione hydrolase
MMWDSLSKLAALPPETLVFSGHEYTQATRASRSRSSRTTPLVARAKDRRRMRAAGRPTVPSSWPRNWPPIRSCARACRR